jgi:NADP-dependent 3-hydroxy acid dehydrogenase YdfG
MSTKKTLKINENSVFLITGGAKGITAQCAVKIAEITHCKFILVGRSSIIKQEPNWAHALKSGKELQKSALLHYKNKDQKVSPKTLQKEIKGILSTREIDSTIQKIKTAGGQAIYISADVTDEASFIPKVQSAVNKIGQISGVIHGAGNLADKLIENKSGSDFDLVVNTKIQGLKNIIKAVKPGDLDFLVLFSSVAGFFGNIGQTDYAIANELLNKSALILDKSLPDCRVISINWGPWDSGMVSPELKKVFLEKNIQLISSENGINALVNELFRTEQKTPQILIGSPIGSDVEINVFNNESINIRRCLNLKNNPFLLDHRIGSQAVLPATCASSWIADTCQSLHPGFNFTGMEDFKILKGLTFNDSDYDVNMELKSIGENKEGEKVYEAIITSENSTNRKVFHYSGRVTLKKRPRPLRQHPPIETFELDSSKYRDGNGLYQDGTLFHGPTFHGIQQVLQVNKEKVITKVLIPQIDISVQGQFSARITNPFINDAIVQSLLLWTQEFYDAPCLPSRLHNWEQFRMIPFDVPVWAILSITYHNDHAVVGNILVQDENGSEFFTYTGLEGTISNHLKRFIGKKDQK